LPHKKNDQVGLAKKHIPIEEGLFTLPSPSDKGHLIGGKCNACGKVVFPKRTSCPVCFADLMDEVALSTRGKVHSCTVFRYRRTPPGYEGGTLPYSYGYVALPEGTALLTWYTGFDLKEPLKVNTEVEMVIEPFRIDKDGNEVMTFKFRPV